MPHKPKPPNPSGLCMCGCGQRTQRAIANNVRRLMVKGHYMRFVRGHGGNRVPPTGGARKAYEPSAEEITSGCELAQSGWTETQRNGRIVDERLRQYPVQPMVIHVEPWLADDLNILRIGRRGM